MTFDDSHQMLKHRVFRALSESSAVFSAIFVVIEAVVRGPLSAHTIAFVGMTVLFCALAVRARRKVEVRGEIQVALGAYFCVLAFVEAASDVPAIGVRCGLFTIPVALVLLSGRAPSLLFYGLASGWTLLMTPYDGERREVILHIMQATGSMFVGAILLGMAWAFDRARAEAVDVAQQRERDLRAALARAEEAVTARTNFLSNMSHEIRTPMNGVLGLSRLMVDEAPNESLRQLAHTVVASGQSLLHILDDILDLSKLDAGALLIDPKPDSPQEIARQLVSLMSARAHEAGLDLTLEVEDDVPEHLIIDGHRLRQVLSNLVGNAIKFTSVGSVRVEMRYAEGELRCAVVDTGIGMAASVLETAFKPFQQADSSTARKFGGTGLGLSICKRLCELMGGRIGADSTEGVGSRFWFAIPAPAAPVVADATPKDDDSRPLAPIRVLVAEDNRVNQLVVRRFLERLGVQPSIVNDGASAIDSVQKQVFDLVLMDRHMPNVDGLEATRRIRQMSGDRARTPIVALTASVMAEDQRACLAAGMNAVLPKPIEVSMLANTLRTYARRK